MSTNLNYDDMLNKMNLLYSNGSLYKKEVPVDYSPVYALPVETSPKITKQQYINYLKQVQLQKQQFQRNEKEKRKLLISATNGSIIKINRNPNIAFTLKL